MVILVNPNMSFTAKEIEQIEKLVLNQQGWELSHEADNVKLFKQPLTIFEKKFSLDCIKLNAVVPFIPEEVHAVTRDVEIRKAVNPNVAHAELLETHDHGDILYQKGIFIENYCVTIICLHYCC